MQELIKVTTNSQGENVVSARELHLYLEIKADFTNWCKRMFEYGFEEDRDFTPILAKSIGGRPSTDFALTLDTAKEIAMLQRTEKGKQARHYFIECEKRVQKSVSLEDALIQQLQLTKAIRLEQEQINQRLNVIEAKQSYDVDYFTVVGFAVYNKRKVSLSMAGQIGKQAKQICAERGYKVDKIRDPRFGEVGSYPSEVLKEVFDNITFPQK
jgi:phage anti-repressor protein